MVVISAESCYHHKMIIVYRQDNCHWCDKFDAVMDYLHKQHNIESRHIDITGKWDEYKHVGFTSTPAVYLLKDDNMIELRSRFPISLMAEIRQYD